MSLVVKRGGPAIVDGDRRLSYDEVDAVLDRVANALLALDLGPERRVAVFAENGAEALLAHLGALFGSASSVPVNFHLAAAEAAHILQDADARLLFVGPENVAAGLAAAAACPAIETVVAWGVADGELPDGTRPAVVAWADWLAGASADPPPTDVVPRPNLLYTSGTTGTPKGVELPPAMFVGGATLPEHLERLTANRFAGFGTHLLAGPMYHTGPLQAVRLLALGVPISIPGRFDAERLLATIERDRVETSVLVPTHFVRLLALPAEVRERYDVSSLRLVAHTGAACPEPVKRAMIDWWGLIFVEAYGGTEAGTVCSITTPEWLVRPGSVGKALPPFEALVVGADGEAAPAGTEGRLYFRDTTGRGIAFRGDPAASAAAHLEPGTFTLGEIGYVDAEGYVFITDRFSDLVVSGGVNLYPAEAEQVLARHPGVADVAVVGVPHPDLGEQLKALVVPVDPADPPTEAELLAFCRDHLTAMKCPRSADLVDSVHRSPMGKLDKRALRAPFWAGQRTIGG